MPEILIGLNFLIKGFDCIYSNWAPGRQVSVIVKLGLPRFAVANVSRKGFFETYAFHDPL